MDGPGFSSLVCSRRSCHRMHRNLLTFSLTEGIATCVVAVVVHTFLFDFPDQAARARKLGFRSFLAPSEVTVILDRIERDRGDATPEKFTFKSVLGHLKDWKIWEYCLLLLCNVRVVS